MANASMLRPTARMSFMALAESIVPDAEARRPLGRILTLMRKCGATHIDDHANLTKSVLRKYYPVLREDVVELARQRPGLRCKVRQLSFYRSGTRKAGGKTRESAVRDRGLVGTCVIVHALDQQRGIDRTFVYEALIASDALGGGKLGLDYQVDLASDCTVVIREEYFVFRAAYYTQQDGIQSVCAHACLKAALWHAESRSWHETRDQDEWEFAPTVPWMNNIAALNAPKNWRPSRGLTPAQVREICRRVGLELKVIPFTDTRNSAFSPFEVAYLYASSGFPTYLTFRPSHNRNRPEHLMPILGHRMNPNEWLPLALSKYTEIPPYGLRTPPRDYLPSVEYVPDLLIHDDLLGPYFSFGSQCLPRRPLFSDDYCGHATGVWVIMPIELGESTSPFLVQQTAAALLPRELQDVVGELPIEWRRRLRERWKGHDRSAAMNMVLRTRGTTAKAYVRHLRMATDHLGNRCRLDKRTSAAIIDRLPAHMWMVEFTLPELRAGNRSKLGELLFPMIPPESADVLNGQRISEPVAFRCLGRLELPEDHLEDYVTDVGFLSHTPYFKAGSGHG
jgi:hypothetical protein